MQCVTRYCQRVNEQREKGEHSTRILPWETTDIGRKENHLEICLDSTVFKVHVFACVPLMVSFQTCDMDMALGTNAYIP